MVVKNKKKKKNKSKYFLLLLVTILIILLASEYKNRILKIFYPTNYSKYVYEYSHQYNLDPYLVFAIIRVESNFNEDAQSHKGAKGLMQITESTGEWIAEKIEINEYNNSVLYDAEYNIKMGCWYLSNLINQFNGDVDLAIAAYNGGIGNVQKWLKNNEYSKDGKTLDEIPFGETDRYLSKIKKDYKIYKALYKDKEN